MNSLSSGDVEYTVSTSGTTGDLYYLDVEGSLSVVSKNVPFTITMKDRLKEHSQIKNEQFDKLTRLHKVILENAYKFSDIDAVLKDVDYLLDKKKKIKLGFILDEENLNKLNDIYKRYRNE